MKGIDMIHTSLSQSDEPSGQPDSFCGEVMSDTQARDAYFNTTKGILAGRPNDADLLQAKATLDDARIAYLYTPDASCPRPMFFMSDRIVIGAAAIAACINNMVRVAST